MFAGGEDDGCFSSHWNVDSTLYLSLSLPLSSNRFVHVNCITFVTCDRKPMASLRK